MTALALTAYEAEIQRIEDEIRALGPNALEPPLDPENATRYAHRLYQRASFNGDLRGLRAAERAIDLVAAQVQRPDDLLLLKASLCLKLHRTGDAQRILESHSELRDTDEVMKIEADLLFQHGRYAEAWSAFLRAIEKNRSWDNLARYAHYLCKFEGADRADEVYAEAEDELTSKQMRSFAWIQLQRGVLDLERGRFEDAGAHFTMADRAYPGYWMVEEHQAALTAARGEHRAAAELYASLTERVAKPELAQTLGDLYRHMGSPQCAQPYYDRALAAFEDSVRRGEVHYYHHLVDYHCSVRDAVEAVRWARKDRELRDNYSTQSALAWALHLQGEYNEAVSVIEKALGSDVIDAHVFSLAAGIYDAAHLMELGHKCAHEAQRLNPRASGVHTHHH